MNKIINLLPHQEKYLEGIIWLFDPRNIAQGRTTVLSIALINVSLNNPNTNIKIFDHTMPDTIEYQFNDFLYFILEELITKINLEFRSHRKLKDRIIYNKLKRTIFYKCKKKKPEKIENQNTFLPERWVKEMKKTMEVFK